MLSSGSRGRLSPSRARPCRSESGRVQAPSGTRKMGEEARSARADRRWQARRGRDGSGSEAASNSPKCRARGGGRRERDDAAVVGGGEARTVEDVGRALRRSTPFVAAHRQRPPRTLTWRGAPPQSFWSFLVLSPSCQRHSRRLPGHALSQRLARAKPSRACPTTGKPPNSYGVWDMGFGVGIPAHQLGKCENVCGIILS